MRFLENFILPLSHDEVVHGKRSLIGRMTGDYWRQFAGLRLLACFIRYAIRGKSSFSWAASSASLSSGAFYEGLEWFLLDYKAHRQHQLFVRDAQPPVPRRKTRSGSRIRTGAGFSGTMPTTAGKASWSSGGRVSVGVGFCSGLSSILHRQRMSTTKSASRYGGNICGAAELRRGALRAGAAKRIPEY